MTLTTKDFRRHCIFYALLCCVVTGLFLPFSTAVTNVFSITAIVFWVLGANIQGDIKKLLARPFALAMIAFLFLVCISAFWKEGSWSSYWSELRNYRRFIFLLVLFLLLQSRQSWREGILFAFFLSTALLTIVCIGIYLGVPFLPPMTPGQGAIFHKSHIAQGFLLGCHMVVAVRYILFSKHIELRVVAVITAFLAFVVSVFMTDGRTGYLCIVGCLVMATFFFFVERKKKIATYFCIILIAALVAGSFSGPVQTRGQAALNDIKLFYQGDKSTSMGQRFYFWQTSINIIKDNPILGVGCGSIKDVTCKYAIGTPNQDGSCYEIRNPHQDFLFVLAQYGVVGFLLWIAFFFQCLKESLSFSLKDKWGIWGVTALYIAGGFFNTFSRDITECTTFVLLVAVLLATQPEKETKKEQLDVHSEKDDWCSKKVKLPISVILLTHNEEKNIADCLASCDFAQEVILVDDQSTDRTVEIAKTFDGVKVFHRALNGDFATQKNYGIAQAKCDWFFFIDADERVTEPLREFIQKAVTEGGKHCYWIQRENHFKNMTVRHGTMRPDWVPRLMPRDGVMVDGCVHEAVVSPFPKQKASGRLLHYSYTSWDQYYSKQMLYSRLAAKKLMERNRPCGFFSHVVFHPIWAFIKVYFFNLGFLDGKAGFVFAANHYAYTLSKYVRYYQMRHFDGVL